MAKSLLKSRWLYVLMLIALGATYARVAMTGHVGMRQPAPETAERMAAMDQSLEPAHLMALARERPLQASVLAVWVLMVIAAGVAGVARNGWLLTSGKFGPWWRGGSPLPSYWSFGDVGRLVVLALFLMTVFPVLHVGWGALGLPGAGDEHLWLVAGMLMLDGMLVVAARAFAASEGRSFRQAFGIQEHTLAPALRQGFLAYITMLPWMAGLLWAIGLICHHLRYTPPPEPIHELLFLESRPGMTVVTLLLACVVGPLAEEVFFRGVLFSALRLRLPFLGAMLISGGLFAALHTNAVGFVPILVLGGLLAWLYECTGSLAAPAAVHVVHNLALVGMALAIKPLASG